jgi:hypothetical protein
MPGDAWAIHRATHRSFAGLAACTLLAVNGPAISPQLELKDFAKAHDGPPTDPKVFAEQQKKLQDELSKRAKDDTLQPQLRPRN